MKKHIVLSKLKHEQNSTEGNNNNNIHCGTIEANTFSEAELIIKTQLARVKCDAEIIQISIYY